MNEVEWAEWFSQLPWGWRVAALVAGALGSVFPAAVVANKLWPDADKRLEDARHRRIEDDERIEHLEAEVKAANDRYYAEREAHIATKERMVATDARLEMMAARMGMGGKETVTPDDVVQDRAALPPGEPPIIDDREPPWRE
jgi:hypothetical protein